MRRPRYVLPVALAAVLALVACGAGKATDPSAASGPGAAGAKDADGGAGVASVVDAAPPPRAFAGSAGEAAELIGIAVEKKAPEVQKCIAEYRTRKKQPHERVSIQLGIDQEGRLLGATLPKGKEDTVLSECVQKALTGAPFPRSHSGVISITKSYEEIVQ